LCEIFTSLLEKWERRQRNSRLPKRRKKELLKGAFLVSQWGSLTEEILPQWGEVNDMLNNIHSHFWYNLKNLTGKQLTQSKLKLNV
jgi:hypothetical protein